MPRCSWFVAVFAFSALLSSCFSLFPEPAFKWADDEHYWRIDEARDVVEWIEIEHGIVEVTEDVGKQLRAVLHGQAVFPPSGGFPSLSLDDLPGDVAVPDDSFAKRIQESGSKVEVVEAHLVLDTAGRATLWRRTKIDHASAWLDAAQQLWSGGDRPVPAVLIDREGALTFDEESRALQNAAMREGLQIWKLDGNAFVVELPMTEENAQRWMDTWQKDVTEPRVRPPAEISFSDQRLRVRYVPDETGWIGAQPYEISADYKPSIVAKLTKAGLSVEPVESYTKLRREAGLH